MIRWVFVFLVLAGTAHAQQGSVKQCSQFVTPGHIAIWTTQGCIADGGTPGNPGVTGGLGVVSTNQQSICTQTSANSPAEQLCLGSTAAGTFLTATGTLPFTIVINGTSYPFPGAAGPYCPLSGCVFTGAISGPGASFATLNSSSGALNGSLGSVTSEAASVTGLNASGAVTFSNIANRVDLYATAVKADGTTSDDVAVAAAFAACSAVSGTLHLPAGQIKLTGAAQIIVKNCLILGAGPQMSFPLDPESYGTTFLLTSTSTIPFLIGSSWGMEGINFYWPNQNSSVLTHYPALMTDNGQGTAFWYLDHVSIVNAYDGIVQNAADTSGWNNFYISNFNGYASHKLFSLFSVGDSNQLTNVHFTPGQWLVAQNNVTATKQAIDASAAQNIIFDIPATTGSPVNLTVTNMIAFDWRYAFKVETGGTMAESVIDMNIDGVQTAIDASATGATWSGVNVVSGSGDCSKFLYESVSTGNQPCFNMGAAQSALYLTKWSATANAGSFITTAGANIFLAGVSVAGIGNIGDGGTYCGVCITANPGALVVNVQSSIFTAGGGSISADTYGILTSGSVSATRFIVQNSEFVSLQSAINYTPGPTSTVTGNTSVNTPSGQISFVPLSSTGEILASGNNWDRAPVASVASCGTTPAVLGGMSGVITVGSGTITACSLTLPWNAYGLGTFGNCTFQPTAQMKLSATASGTPATWVITSDTDMHGDKIYYNCPGQQ